MSTLLPVDEDARWIIAKDSFGALDKVDAIVRTRRTDIMLQHDRPAARSFYDAGVVVACLVNLFPLRITRRYMLLAIGLEGQVRRTHRHNVIKTIATVDVHVHRHWTKPVRVVKIAIAQRVMSATPQTLVLILKQNLAQ